MTQPKPLFMGKSYVEPGEVKFDSSMATAFWIENKDGGTYTVKWWNSGWVVEFRESYLSKEGHFKHKENIPLFAYSNHPSNVELGHLWEHVFATKELAVEAYRTMLLPKFVRDEEFYKDVYDILVELGGAADGHYRDAFMFNFSKEEKFATEEWRFQGKLGFGGKYWREQNIINCYSEDETPEVLELITIMNTALKTLTYGKE